VFLSTDGGGTWALVTDPVDGTGATPHISRPRLAYMDIDAGENRRLFIASQGRGIWRLTLDTSVPVTLEGFDVN
jgi:hypothetical protein